MKHFTPTVSRTIGLLIALAALLVLNMTQAQSLGDYRSAGSGNWAAAGTWERHNGTTFIAAGIAPSSTDGVITVRAGHAVTQNTNITVDEVVVEATATLNSSALALTINDGAGADLSVSGTWNLNGASVNGPGHAQVNSGGAFTWSNGGRLETTCVLDLLAGSTSTFNHTTTQFNFGTINNAGTWNMDGGNLSVNTGALPAAFNNLSGGVVNLNGWLFNTSSWSQATLNQGTFNKNNGATLFTFANDFSGKFFHNENGGTLSVPDGTLDFICPTTNAGSMTTGATGILQNSTTFSNDAGGTITNTFVQTGALTLNAPITLNTFTLTGGTVAGPAAITIPSGGAFNWSGGTLTSTSTLELQAGSTTTFTPASTLFNMGTINHAGTWNMQSGNLSVNSSLLPAAFNNLPGAIVNLNGWAINTNSWSQVTTNQGTFNKNNGATLFTFANDFSFKEFNNEPGGVVNVPDGVLVFQLPANNASNILCGAGATVRTIAGGIFNSNAGGTINGPFELVGGTLNVNAALTLSRFDLVGGTLNGPQSLIIGSGGEFNWSSGPVTSTATLDLQAGSTTTFSPASTLINMGTIHNAGTWNMQSGNLSVNSGLPPAAFNNLPGGIVNLNGWASNTNSWSQATTNQGTFNKNNGATPFTFANDFSGKFFTNQTGAVVNVNSGTLNCHVFFAPQNGTFNIPTGATLNSTVDLSYIGTQITNNGTITALHLIFSGSAAQQLNGTGTVNNLKINNASGITIADTQTITTNLNFTLGNITLGNSDLPLSIAATISGGSSASYLATTGTGNLRRHVLNNATNVFFPVGTATSFLPANVQLTALSTEDDISARVEGGVSSDYDVNGNATGFPLTTHIVQGAWHITEAVVGGSDATVQLQWNGTNEGLGFVRANSSVMHFNGSAWTLGTLGAASGADPFTRSRNGITTFSPFSVGDDLSTGVDLVEFDVAHPMIFPVPAVDGITIRGSANVQRAVAIDAAGRAQMLPMLGNNRFDVQALATGVYVFEGLGANGMIRSRFVKE